MRSATAGARGTPSATWAAPTPVWARPSGPSASTSRAWRSREIGDRRGEGADLGSLGLAYYHLGQAERAIGFYEQYLAIAEIGDRRVEGRPRQLGNAYRPGQAERAIGFFEQHWRRAREIGDRWGEGTDLGSLGLAYDDLGQAEGPSALRAALAIRARSATAGARGTALVSLGLAYYRLGQAERAIGFYEQAACD